MCCTLEREGDSTYAVSYTHLYKYFDCENIDRFAVTTRGYADGVFEIRTKWDGEVLGCVQLHYTNIWNR